MKRLILMRHGEAPLTVGEEDERTLSTYGKSGVEQTARYIKEHYKIENILCSTAKRNRQTLEIVQKIIADNSSVDFSDDIYQNDPEILKDLVTVCAEPAETILLLGHNPSLLTFALDCDKDGYHEWIDELSQGFIPAEIVIIEFDKVTTWKEAMETGGKIKDIFIPR